jgi:glycosyltransferase involved in cell wall biosynthesis
VRVLFLSQIVPYPPHGGVLQRGYNILRELGRQAEVHLLAFVHPDELHTPEQVVESRRALEAFCERVEFFPLWAKGNRVQRVVALTAGILSPRPFSTIAHRSAAFRRSARAALDTGRYDLVHVDTVGLNPFVEPRPGVATVLTHHNIESMLMERRAAVEPGRFARWALRRESRKLTRYEALAAPRYEVNIMMSAVDEAVLAGRVPGIRTAVVPNGVDIDYFAPAAVRRESPALVYAGGMNMFANRDAVLHFLDAIWPLVKAHVPEVTFSVVGQDPPKELLEIAARDQGVRVLGKVPDIRPYINEAAVYVVPLRVGGGTRLKVLDALASGKAIVSTSLGCEGIDVRHGEHLLVADHPEAFAAAVVRLLQDEALRLRFSRAARDVAERLYAWPTIGKRLMSAYRCAIQSRGRQ